MLSFLRSVSAVPAGFQELIAGFHPETHLKISNKALKLCHYLLFLQMIPAHNRMGQ